MHAQQLQLTETSAPTCPHFPCFIAGSTASRSRRPGEQAKQRRSPTREPSLSSVDVTCSLARHAQPTLMFAPVAGKPLGWTKRVCRSSSEGVCFIVTACQHNLLSDVPAGLQASGTLDSGYHSLSRALVQRSPVRVPSWVSASFVMRLGAFAACCGRFVGHGCH